MDELNRAIVERLLRDGRATYQEVGNAVGLSAPAVKRRVDLMLARGEIAGFTVHVTPAAMGWTLEGYVEIFCDGIVAPAVLRRDLSPIPEVVRVATVTGDADALGPALYACAADSCRPARVHAAALRSQANAERPRDNLSHASAERAHAVAASAQ
jgi:DNA-binding Lrp family transcriptional regulator